MTDLALLKAAALAAGEITLRHWRSAPDHWDKGAGQGPVSEADLEVDRMLKAELTAARPGYGWLSEETEDGDARLGQDRVFIVDPIDGTRAFLDGQTPFSNVIAVAERGEIIAAAVHLPAKGRTYLAAKGAGATVNDAPLTVARPGPEAKAQVLATRPNMTPDQWPGGVPDIDRHFRPSLAYRMALVAEGRFDAMLTFRDAWEWDVAAGALLIDEAGGMVTDSDGEKLLFNNPVPKVPGILAADRALHARLLAQRRNIR